MKVKLTGITRHGKNRVNEQGEFWKLLRKQDHVAFSDEPGPWWFLESILDPKHVRWVRTGKDKDFVVLEILD